MSHLRLFQIEANLFMKCMSRVCEENMFNIKYILRLYNIFCAVFILNLKKDEEHQ